MTMNFLKKLLKVISSHSKKFYLKTFFSDERRATLESNLKALLLKLKQQEKNCANVGKLRPHCFTLKYFYKRNSETHKSLV